MQERGFMRHCCAFKADDIYYLEDSDIYSHRKLSIGFCPVCNKPVAELVEWRFDGQFNRISLSGIKAQYLVMDLKEEIVYSLKENNYLRFKSKPFGWKYGINKESKIGGKKRYKQYACDFYGNKELIKTY